MKKFILISALITVFSGLVYVLTGEVNTRQKRLEKKLHKVQKEYREHSGLLARTRKGEDFLIRDPATGKLLLRNMKQTIQDWENSGMEASRVKEMTNIYEKETKIRQIHLAEKIKALDDDILFLKLELLFKPLDLSGNTEQKRDRIQRVLQRERKGEIHLALNPETREVYAVETLKIIELMNHYNKTVSKIGAVLSQAAEKTGPIRKRLEKYLQNYNKILREQLKNKEGKVNKGKNQKPGSGMTGTMKRLLKKARPMTQEESNEMDAAFKPRNSKHRKSDDRMGMPVAWGIEDKSPVKLKAGHSYTFKAVGIFAGNLRKIENLTSRVKWHYHNLKTNRKWSGGPEFSSQNTGRFRVTAKFTKFGVTDHSILVIVEK